MQTEIIRLADGGTDRSPAVRGAEILGAGGLVAFPTETVYGVGARADIPDAVARLREVKGRSVEKAFTVHVHARQAALPFIEAPGGLAQRLMRRGWPGPLTIILPAAAEVPASARESIVYDGWVGLRCPDDPISSELLRLAAGPVVASSANVAGNPPPQTAEDVLRDLKDRIDLLIDTGRTRYSKPSTIVKVTGSTYEVLREGVHDAGSVARMAALRVLFVCTGNTCRSPMAAGVAAKMAADRLQCPVPELPAYGVIIQSAGTAGGFGRVSESAVRVMARRGIDISNHTSTPLTPDLVHQADFVFTMTQQHREAAIAMARQAEQRVSELIPGQDLADPVGGSEADYESCARAIEQGLVERFEEIMQ